MKQLTDHSNRKYLWILLALIFLPLLFIGFVKYENWHKDHYIQTNVPIEVKFKPVFEVMTKEEPKVVEKAMEIPDVIVDTPLKKFICDQFGPLDCKIALAVAQAESGFKEDAININTNGTIDVGIFQINQIHYGKLGCALKEVAIAEQNVMCAYNIFKNSGWSAWSAFNNSSFLAHVDK